MNYYILSQDVENEEEDAMLEGYSAYLDRIRVPFDEGEELPLEDILIPIEINVEVASLRGRMTDSLFLDEVDCLIISKKVIEFLDEQEIENIQLLPIKLIDPYSNAEEVEEAKLKDKKLDYKKKIYDNYSIFNITGLVDCINHEDSNLEYYEPRTEIAEDLPENMKLVLEEQQTDNEIDFIRKLVLDEDKIPEDLKIFRLKDCPRILVFKEEIVKAIRKEKLTGFVFVPLEKYTDEIPDDDDDDQEESEQAEVKAPSPKPKVEKKVVAEKKEEEKAAPKKSKPSIVIKKIKRNR